MLTRSDITILMQQVDVTKAYDLLAMFKDAGKERIDIRTVYNWKDSNSLNFSEYFLSSTCIYFLSVTVSFFLKDLCKNVVIQFVNYILLFYICDEHDKSKFT